jgi:prophage tail gpP-like protein
VSGTTSSSSGGTDGDASSSSAGEEPFLEEEAGEPARPKLTLRLGSAEKMLVFEDVIRAEVVRDLEELSGSFRVELLDRARFFAALPGWWQPTPARGIVMPGERAEILLDGEVVLIGWIDAVEANHGPDKTSLTIQGRDVTGDLVDCAASVDGPHEYRDLTLTEIVARICQPFGISVRAEVDVGAPFPRFAIEAGETALSAIEKACRQRAVLAVSDGVGGLLLTRGGKAPAPAQIVFGGNIQTMDCTFDWTDRFSLYVVRGQAERPMGGAPALDGTANPLTAAAPERRPAPSSPAGERPRIALTGRAEDPVVARYRPTVALAKTQSGGVSVQEQAEWMMRTARAKSEALRVTVPYWRAGEEDRLWRCNERVAVDDPLAGVACELLVAGLTWRWDEQGARTELRLCGCDAFDILPEGEQQERQRQPARRPLDGQANPLTPEPPPRAAR